MHKKKIILVILSLVITTVTYGTFAETLNITMAIDGFSPTSIKKIESDFATNNDNIALSIIPAQNETEIVDSLTNHDSTVDIYCISTKYGTLNRIMKKRFYVDLSDVSEVNTTVMGMYSQYRDICTDGSLIAAYPYNVYFDQMFLWDENALSIIGLGIDALPKTFDGIAELQCEFEDDDEFASDKKAKILYTGASTALLHPLLKAYKDFSISKYGTLKYDTEIFRKLLENVNNTKARQDDPSKSDDGGPEYIALYMGKGTDKMAIGEGNTKPVAISLTSNTEPVVPIYFTCLLINPYSKSIKDAKQVISQMISYQSPLSRMIMIPDEQEVIENPDYHIGLSERESTLAECRSALECATEENKPGLEDIVKECEEDIVLWKTHNRYLVSTESLNHYLTEIHPYVYVKGMSEYDSQDIDQAIFRLVTLYDENGIETEDFIEELDRIVWMMAMEEQ